MPVFDCLGRETGRSAGAGSGTGSRHRAGVLGRHGLPAHGARRVAEEHIALVVERDIDLLTALRRAAAPDPVIVLLQGADIREALPFDPRPGLALGEAVGPFDRAGGLAV